MIMLGVLSGCATSSVTIESVPPKATVFVKPLGGGSRKQLGETPITSKNEDLEKDFGGSGPVVLEFAKEGYRNTTVMVTELSRVKTTVTAELRPLQGFDDPALLNAQIEQLFEAQRLMRIRRFDESLKILGEIKRIAPTLSSPYEMEGGIHYLSGRMGDSLDSYRMAVKLNPKSVEAVRMKGLLEAALDKQGGRLPASSAPAAPAAGGAH